MAKDKRSFFERLTGTVKLEHNDDDDTAEYEPRRPERKLTPGKSSAKDEAGTEWIEESNEEGQLTADVYQTPTDIVIKTIVAGVKPDDLDISISRDMVTLRGAREESREVSDDDYFHRELYWGSFSRTILLPEEIDVEASEAVCRDGLLTIRLPKIDKRRQTKLKVKSS
jgi:HSP20 family protein